MLYIPNIGCCPSCHLLLLYKEYKGIDQSEILLIFICVLIKWAKDCLPALSFLPICRQFRPILHSKFPFHFHRFLRVNLIPILMKRLSLQIDKYEYKHSSPVCDQSKYLSTRQSLNMSGNTSPLSPGM